MKIHFITKRQEREARLRQLEADLRRLDERLDNHKIYRHNDLVSINMLMRVEERLSKRLEALEGPQLEPDQEAAALVQGYIETEQSPEDFEAAIADALRRRSER